MTHIDREDLALHALGEPLSAEQAAHFDECRDCAEELAELRAAARIGRETAMDDRLLSPSPRVWAAIGAELGLTDAGPVAPAVPGRRRPRRRVLLALAAGVLVVAGTAGLLLLGVLGGDRARLVARADLVAQPGWEGAAGSADLERLPDGRLAVHVHVETPGVGRDYRELWLLNEGATAAVSLGVVAEADAVYAVPHDVDLDRYGVVDVSREAPDGDPSHSTDSIVRGVLRR